MLWTRRRDARRGQATLEMAVILPVLAMLTMGIIECGLLLNSYITVVNLSREGARVAVDGALNEEIRSVLFTEGSKRIPTYATNVAVLIARGRVADADNTPPARWSLDPCNPAGWTMGTQQADIQGMALNGTEGFEYVVVEVRYNHPTVTRIPFASDIMVSSRSVIRTAARNEHTTPCP